MSIIIDDNGFRKDTWTKGFLAWDDTILFDRPHPPGYAIDMPNSAHPHDLVAFFDDCAMIRIAFPNFIDGRGFSLARQLRLLGFKQCLRANGYIIADQYAMARRCGFNEIEISSELAARQTEDQWIFRTDWRADNYLNRLQAQ